MTWHTPNWLPNIPFSASANGSVGITLSAGVNNGSLVVTIGGINNVNLNMDFDGIPDIIPGLSDLGNYIINTLLTPLINQFLSGKSFSVYSIPTIKIPLGPGINRRTHRRRKPTFSGSWDADHLIIEATTSPQRAKDDGMVDTDRMNISVSRRNRQMNSNDNILLMCHGWNCT
jgi:hypothetical protein